HGHQLLRQHHEAVANRRGARHHRPRPASSIPPAQQEEPVHRNAPPARPAAPQWTNEGGPSAGSPRRGNPSTGVPRQPPGRPGNTPAAAEFGAPERRGEAGRQTTADQRPQPPRHRSTAPPASDAPPAPPSPDRRR